MTILSSSFNAYIVKRWVVSEQDQALLVFQAAALDVPWLYKKLGVIEYS